MIKLICWEWGIRYLGINYSSFEWFTYVYVPFRQSWRWYFCDAPHKRVVTEEGFWRCQMTSDKLYCTTFLTHNMACSFVLIFIRHVVTTDIAALSRNYLCRELMVINEIVWIFWFRYTVVFLQKLNAFSKSGSKLYWDCFCFFFFLKILTCFVCTNNFVLLLTKKFVNFVNGI